MLTNFLDGHCACHEGAEEDEAPAAGERDNQPDPSAIRSQDRGYQKVHRDPPRQGVSRTPGRRRTRISCISGRCTLASIDGYDYMTHSSSSPPQFPNGRSKCLFARRVDFSFRDGYSGAVWLDSASVFFSTDLTHERARCSNVPRRPNHDSAGILSSAAMQVYQIAYNVEKGKRTHIMVSMAMVKPTRKVTASIGHILLCSEPARIEWSEQHRSGGINSFFKRRGSCSLCLYLRHGIADCTITDRPFTRLP